MYKSIEHLKVPSLQKDIGDHLNMEDSEFFIELKDKLSF